MINSDYDNIKYIIGYITNYKYLYYINSYNRKLDDYPVVVDNIEGGVIKLASSQTFHIQLDKLYFCKVTSTPTVDNSYFTVDIINEFGDKDDHNNFLQALLIEQEISHSFNQAQEKEANRAKMPKTITSDRVDLRDLPFFTIDGSDAKDFDDAICGNLLANKNYQLLVAIADVDFFVPAGSLLDQEAYNRGTSIYLPTGVIPMLPEQLSNDLCSLQPAVDRLVMVCDMEIDQQGNIINYDVYNAVIKSQQRTTYDQVYNFLSQQNDSNDLKEPVKNNLLILYEIYQALLISRKRRGALDFHTVSSTIILNSQGCVDKILGSSTNEAHQLVEEMMLAANLSVANFIEANNSNALYRIHDKPTAEKVDQLKSYVESLGVKWKVANSELITTKDFQLLIKKIRTLDDSSTIENVLLRYLMLAQYSSDNIGHFGLAYDQYVHFTSPIRRYADLVIHRICKAILEKKQLLLPLPEIASYLLEANKKVDNLVRVMISYYKCLYAKQHLGCHYYGIVTAVNSFGVFIYIDQLMLDGLVHLTALADDFYNYNQKSQQLVGKFTGVVYSVGDKMEVIIASVDLNKLFINLELL